MNREFWSEFPAAVNELDASGEARALVISSSGKHFCSGMDLSVFTSGGGGSSEATGGHARGATRTHVLQLQETMNCLERARMPVLAAIQGGCIGGGVDLIAACDSRYASADAFFCIQEINIGMTADVGTLQRLPKLIPEGVCRELAYTGRRMPADEAKAVGLINEVFDDHEALLEGVLDVARTIAAKPPIAIQGTKVSVNYARDHSTADALEHIATWQAGMFQPSDMVEAFNAKAEDRDGEFEDLLPFRGGLADGV